MGGFLEELLMYFSSVCICVCVQCICSPLSLFDGLIWVPLCRQRGLCWESSHWHQLPCGWSETICSRRILNTTAVKGVARSKRSLRGFYWFPHLRASLLLLITDQGTASCTSPWATGAQLEQLVQWQAACIMGAELCCLFRETSVWFRFYNWMCGRKQLQVSVNNLTTWAGFQLQCPWYKRFTNYLGNLISCWKWQIQDRVNKKIWQS